MRIAEKSRAKLAYLVDSTAAPVATLALVSTWIGYEVSLIDEAIQSLDAAQRTAQGLEGLCYAFFEGLPIVLPNVGAVFWACIVGLGRDFDQCWQQNRMLRAVWLRAQKNHQTLGFGSPFNFITDFGHPADPGPQGIRNHTFAPLFEIISAADGYDAMLRGALAALCLAIVTGLLSGVKEGD